MTTPPTRKLPPFDPRQVPVVGVDRHLPAVSAAQLEPQALRQRFGAPPVWVPEVSLEHKFSDRPMADAAVLIAIVLRDQPMVLLTERSTQLATHSGQIAFPGGRVDADDRDLSHTALREAQEEVGLDASFIQILGHLPTYTTGTSFVVTPVVALVQPGFVLSLNPNEVADAFEVPLVFLMNPAHHHRHVFEWEGQRREWFSIPFYDSTTERFIWGATAGMLRNFYRFLAA